MGQHPVFTNDMLDRLRRTGDPPLDRLLVEMSDVMDGAWSLGKLFGRVHDIPRLSCEELEQLRDEGMITGDIVEFFRSDCKIPDEPWIDRAMVYEGGRFYRDRGVVGFMVLAFASLPACYCWSTEAEVLGYTGKLMVRDVPRRIPETAQFVIDVVEAGAFEPEGIGIHSAHKIRLLHAIVRHMVKDRDAQKIAVDTGVRAAPPGSSDDDAFIWDHPGEEPISQELLAATLLTFHYIVLDGMRRLGVSIDEGDERAYLHRWNVVGRFLGIDVEILRNLGTMEDAGSLLEMMMQRKRAETDTGYLLEDSLLAYISANILNRVLLGRFHPLLQIPGILTFYLSGDATSRALRVRLSVTQKALYHSTIGFFYLVGKLNNYPVMRFLTGRLLAGVAHKIWGWRKDAFRGTLRPGEPHPETPEGSIIMPATLASEWRLPGWHRSRPTANDQRDAG